MTSRFLQKVACRAEVLAEAGLRPVTRFLARHHRINRIVRKIPIVTKFMAFFVPEELRLDPPKNEPVAGPAADAATPHIAPVYNARARKPKGLTLG